VGRGLSWLSHEVGAFKVIPCDDWYSFKREPKNIPLPLEEAEKLLKEWVKGERASANTGEMAKASNIRDKMSQIKKEDREKKPSKDKFNATGEEVELEDDDFGGFAPKRKKKKKEKLWIMKMILMMIIKKTNFL